MAETKEKKGFKAGLYAVIAGVLVAAILIGLTVFAFTTRYNAFKPEKIATEYIDTIVQSGDGYNAYKYSLVSKTKNTAISSSTHIWHPMLTTATMLSKPIS